MSQDAPKLHSVPREAAERRDPDQEAYDDACRALASLVRQRQGLHSKIQRLSHAIENQRYQVRRAVQALARRGIYRKPTE